MTKSSPVIRLLLEFGAAWRWCLVCFCLRVKGGSAPLDLDVSGMWEGEMVV